MIHVAAFLDFGQAKSHAPELIGRHESNPAWRDVTAGLPRH
jgi:hypothetical protein